MHRHGIHKIYVLINTTDLPCLHIRNPHLQQLCDSLQLVTLHLGWCMQGVLPMQHLHSGKCCLLTWRHQSHWHSLRRAWRLIFLDAVTVDGHLMCDIYSFLKGCSRNYPRGGTFFFQTPPSPGHTWSRSPPRPPGHVSALINLPHYGSNTSGPPGQVTSPPPTPRTHCQQNTLHPQDKKVCPPWG